MYNRTKFTALQFLGSGGVTGFVLGFLFLIFLGFALPPLKGGTNSEPLATVLIFAGIAGCVGGAFGTVAAVSALIADRISHNSRALTRTLLVGSVITCMVVGYVFLGTPRGTVRFLQGNNESISITGQVILHDFVMVLALVAVAATYFFVMRAAAKRFLNKD